MFEGTSATILAKAFSYAFMLAPILLPIPLAVVFWEAWVNYVRRLFFAKQKHTLLQIKLPQEITKTPLAMELFFTTLHQTGGEGTWYDRYWLGKTRPWFSLELVSNGGDVNFFIWTRDAWKKHIETQLYAQFPGIEVSQVDDYAKDVDFDLSTHNLWGCVFKLNQPDPLPIKTYVDYGLDKMDEEEFKNDPITPIIEFLGSITPGEYAWYQILIRAHKKEDAVSFKISDPKTWNFLKYDAGSKSYSWNSDFNLLDPFSWLKRTDKWVDKAKDEIKKVRESGLIEYEEDGIKKKTANSTKGQNEKIAAIERSVSKLPFDVGIRCMYIAEKDKYNGLNVSPLNGAFRQFNSLDLNQFVPTGGLTVLKGYPWEDMSGKKTRAIKNNLYEEYVKRLYFYPPHDLSEEKFFVLNTEELATIYHFPGRVSQTPTFTRVLSKKGQPPANLPI